MHDGPLGRLAPTDWAHVDKYPLSALPQKPVGVPVAIGVNWYSNFDSPVLEAGRYWIGRGNLGLVRGGHCVALKSVQRDPDTWWEWYDQRSEGACVGFGCSRVMSLLNRRRYYARWLWDQAKLVDEWEGTRPGDDDGTSVRAAMDVLRTIGHCRWKGAYKQETDYQERDEHPGVLEEGIAANRWATNAQEVLDTIALPVAHKLLAVPILNSWGRAYPHIVWMPAGTLQRLIDEDGEVALITDR